jgi:hypothetical protein
MLFRKAVVAVVIVSLAGCSTMRAVEDVSPQGVRERVEVGDEVRIVTTQGAVYELEVTKVEEKSLTGEAGNGKRYRVPYAAIQALEVEEVSAAKTGGAITAGMVAVYAAAIAFMLMLAREFKPGGGDD